MNRIEDIIDDKFVDEERLQSESALYKIVNGIFTDPFIDIRPPEFKQKKDATKTPNQTNLKKEVNKRQRTKANKSKPNKKLKVNH